jgi:hypothetical protein
MQLIVNDRFDQFGGWQLGWRWRLSQSKSRSHEQERSGKQCS